MSFLPDSHVVNGREGLVPKFVQDRISALAPKYNYFPSFAPVEISDVLVSELASKHPAITDRRNGAAVFMHQ